MTPIDWSKTKIYKIVCKDLSITECYVGSTTNIVRRRCQHKGACNSVGSVGHALKKYAFIRANGGWDNWELILVEDYIECTSGEMARQRERFWYEELEARLNINRPFVSREEILEDAAAYREANKDKHKKYTASHYESNKDKIKECVAAYRESNKDKIRERMGAYYESNKVSIKERAIAYYESNKDKVKEYQADYREINSAKVKARKVAYYEANKAKIKEYKAAYYETNKDKINACGAARYRAKKASML